MISDGYLQISSKAIKVRNIHELITSIIGLIVLAVLLFCTYHFEWWNWLTYVWVGLIVITIMGIPWTYMISSPLFYKTFRYKITDDFLYIKSGIWQLVEVVVPMAKVQSIELNQGALMRKHGVATVKVSTMNDHQEIPYIEYEVAQKLRDDIAKLARLKELDE